MLFLKHVPGSLEIPPPLILAKERRFRVTQFFEGGSAGLQWVHCPSSPIPPPAVLAVKQRSGKSGLRLSSGKEKSVTKVGDRLRFSSAPAATNVFRGPL